MSGVGFALFRDADIIEGSSCFETHISEALDEELTEATKLVRDTDRCILEVQSMCEYTLDCDECVKMAVVRNFGISGRLQNVNGKRARRNSKM